MLGLDLLPPTADVSEAVWTLATALGTLVAAIGAGLTTTNLRAARRAHRRAVTTANRLHTMITGQAVRNEAISVGVLAVLLVTLATFAAIGAFAMLTPDPVRAELRTVDFVTTMGLVSGAVIVTIATAALTIGSVLNRRDRHRLTNLITGRILADQMARRGLDPETSKE